MIIAGSILFVLLFVIFIKLALLGLSVKKYAGYWENLAAQPIPERAITYVALGDSAAQGVGASSPQKGYVGLLADSLAKKHDKPIHTVNLSVTGAKIQDVTNTQLPKLRALEPESSTVITLDIGSNDMITDDPATFESHLGTLFSELPAQTIVADIPYFGGGRYRSFEPRVKEANKTIHRLAKTYNLRVAPLYEVTKRRERWFKHSIDFLHPSNAGYKDWHEAFAEVISL